MWSFFLLKIIHGKLKNYIFLQLPSRLKKKLKGPKSNVIVPFKAYKVKVRSVKLQQMFNGYIDAQKIIIPNNVNYQRVHGVHLVYYFNLPGTEHLEKATRTLVVQK